MKKLLSLIGLFLFILQSNAQNLQSDAQNLQPITRIGRLYYQGYVRLKVKNIKEIVEPIPLAYQDVKLGKSLMTCSYILGIMSVMLVAEGVSDLIAGDESSSSTTSNDKSPGAAIGVIGVGIAGVIFAIVLDNSSRKRIVKGINIYNSSISSKSASNSFSINLGLSNHGMGLTVRF